MDSPGNLPASYLNTVNLPLNIFLFIGLDFLNDPKNSVRNRCKLVFFIITFLTFFSGQILFVVMIMTDATGATFIDVANAIPCLFIGFIDAFKLITLLWKKHLVRQILLDIAELWPIGSQPEHKNKIKNELARDLKIFAESNSICFTQHRDFVTTMLNLQICIFLNLEFRLRYMLKSKFHIQINEICIFKVTTGCVILYISAAMFIYFFFSLRDDDTPYLYAFQLYCPFKVDALWKYLLIYLVPALMALVIHTCLFHATDMFLYTLTCDVCILLRMLEYDLVNLRVERKGPQAGRCLIELRHIVTTHQKLMRLANSLNDIFGVIMSAVIIFSSGMLCFFGFLAMVARTKYQIFLNATALAHAFFVVFYITLPGQILANTSSEFANAAYASSWYDSGIEFRRIIYIIIARSLTPCTLRALGHIDMNFGTYSTICSTAWSYLSVLNKTYQDVEFDF